MNQLEELFNEKLGIHSIPPPAGSWERVAANLSKKNKTIIWVRWAAVLVVGMLMIGVIATRQSAPVEIAAKKTPTPQNNQEQKKEEPLAAISAPEKKAAKKIVRKRTVESSNTNETTAAPVTEASQQIADEAQPEAVIAATEQVVVEPTKESKVASRSIVLTYTLAPVVAVSPETEPVTADAGQKSSSLGKVVKFARDVKNGDSPLSLKDVKEDLFAHSKKKTPTKTH